MESANTEENQNGTEVAVRVEDDGHRRTIHVEGPVDLPHAGALRQTLLESLSVSAALPVVLDLHALERVDLVGLQLLCSSHRTAVLRGGNITVGDAPDWFHTVCNAAGFARSRSTCPHRRGDNCLWRA